MELLLSDHVSYFDASERTYVTTPKFLVAFDLQSLRDLSDMEVLVVAGLAE